MSLRETAPLTEEAARNYSPLQLAHLGDSVWELLVRSRIAWKGRSVRHMHSDAIARVNAHAQAQALVRIEPLLTEAESDIVRRGRNAHAHHAAPRNQDPADYSHATGLEALFGFLYLSGQDDRLQTLFQASQEEP